MNKSIVLVAAAVAILPLVQASAEPFLERERNALLLCMNSQASAAKRFKASAASLREVINTACADKVVDLIQEMTNAAIYSRKYFENEGKISVDVGSWNREQAEQSKLVQVLIDRYVASFRLSGPAVPPPLPLTKQEMSDAFREVFDACTRTSFETKDAASLLAAVGHCIEDKMSQRDLLPAVKAVVITLKLIHERGGKALVNTTWAVIAPTGDVIRGLDEPGDVPRVSLYEGHYRVIARNNGKQYYYHLDVKPGANREIEVLAK